MKTLYLDNAEDTKVIPFFSSEIFYIRNLQAE
jgi:hypothetical protein